MVVEAPGLSVRLARESDPAAYGSDDELLGRLRRGDADAFNAIVREYTGRLAATARRFLRCEHDRADVVQEAFIAAYHSVKSFNGTSSVGTWLHRILVNCCLMRLRAQRRRPTITMGESLLRFDSDERRAADDRSAPRARTDETEPSDLSTRTRDCVHALPEPYYAILVLREVEGLDTRKTGEILGISATNVKTRLHRARQALRTLIEEREARQAELLP